MEQHSQIYRVGENSSKNTVFSNTGLFQETKNPNKQSKLTPKRTRKERSEFYQTF